MDGTKLRVFLSHSSDDKSDIEKLARLIKDKGHDPWFDKWNLIPGAEWQPAIEKALDDCDCCVVVIGPHGLGPWQHEEMRAAIARRVESGRSRFRVIPVLLPGVDRPEQGKLPSFLRATTWVEFRTSLQNEEAFHRLICGIEGKEPGSSDSDIPALGSCPYRGLEAFDVEHAPFFFGREAETEWLVEALRPRVGGEENRFLAILGPSGSGKSSLARAGLAATLKKGALEGSSDWPLVILKPGRDPLEALTVALAGQPGGASFIASTRELLNIKAFGDDPKSLHVFVRLALQGFSPARRIVVLVDQAEEVFTLCEDEAKRRVFFENLHHAGTVPGGGTIVILTIRADFYGKCASYPALAASMSAHQQLIGPMSDDGLRRAIERPGTLAGGEFESGLVKMLFQDVSGQPGSLPLLQFALMELWERRDGRRMTVDAYTEIGGLKGALKNRADNALAQLDDSRRELCRQIFLRLTQPGEGREDTKRRVSSNELLTERGDHSAVEAVVRLLADARLITTEANPQNPQEYSVEVAHEALIRGWDPLRKWIEADRAGLKIHRQLSDAAKEWEGNGRENSFLYQGTRLSVARDWAELHASELNELEARFLRASLSKQMWGKVVRGLSVAAVIALAFGGWEQSQRSRRAEFINSSVDIEKILHQAEQDSQAAHWEQAITWLEAALKRLRAEPEYEPLRRRVTSDLDKYKAAGREQKILHHLSESRLAGAASAKEGGYDMKAVVTGYRNAFKDAGIEVTTLSEDELVESIRTERSPQVRQELAAALEDWASKEGDARLAERLVAVARKADRDPLREEIRQAQAKRDISDLKRLATVSKALDQPVPTLLRLTSALSQAGAVDEAVTLLRKAQRRRPQDFWINSDLSDALTRLTPPRFDEAIRYSSIAVAIKPESPGAIIQLQFALRMAGRLEESLAYCDEAVRLLIGNQPSLSIALKNRGNVYCEMRDYDKAIADFDSAIKGDPRYVYAYDDRGKAYTGKRDFGRAIADFDKAIALDSKQRFIYLDLGKAYFQKRDYDAAIANFDKALSLDSNYVFAYLDRGKAYAEKRDYDRAIADFDKAIALDQSFVFAYVDRGNARRAKREYAKAIDDYRKASRVDPKSPWAYLYLAWILATCPDDKIRNGSRAVEEATRAIELNGDKAPGFLDVLAAAHAEVGDFDAAVRTEEEALKLLSQKDPDRTDFESRLKLYRSKLPYRANEVGR